MNYQFEYLFIPLIIANFNGDNSLLPNMNIFDDFESLQNAFELEYECEGEDAFDWNRLYITKYISKHFSYYFFIFPPKMGEIDALYGMIVQYKGKMPMYFTFENSQSGKYVFGMKNVDVHRNFGVMDILDKKGFRDLVFEKLKKCPELLDPTENEAEEGSVIDEKDIIIF